jgi:uncharacterized membrane protein
MSNKALAKTNRMVGAAIFAAMVVVLQLVATYIKFGPFAITLALTPIVVGAALYGSSTGLWLGGAFGAVVLAACITGGDPGGAYLWSINPFFTAVICLGKGLGAGLVSALVYSAIAKKNVYAGVVCAAVLCPIVNTGMFIAFMFLFFRQVLAEWAGGGNVVYYAFIGMTGVNFLLEMAANVILSPVVARIIHITKKTA